MLDSLSAGDRAHLQELYARSLLLPELKRLKEWVELFEPQATFRCLQAGAGRVAELRFSGRGELLDLGERISCGRFDVAVGDLAQGSRLRHVITNLCLFESGTSRASGIAQVGVVSILEREPRWIASGIYTDELYKCGAGCWRFLSRKFVPDGVMGASTGQTRTTGFPRPVTLA